MRPKKTLDDLAKGWKKKMISMSSKGASATELKVAIGGISNDLWDRFIAEEPEFSETVQQCKLLCQAWWEKFGREHLVSERGESVNSTMYTFNMKNRFGWADRTENTNENKHTVTIIKGDDAEL